MIVVIAVGIVAVIAGTGAGFVSGKLYGRSIEYRRNNQSGSADKLKYPLPVKRDAGNYESGPALADRPEDDQSGPAIKICKNSKLHQNYIHIK